jgi:dihydropteroate synthase
MNSTSENNSFSTNFTLNLKGDLVTFNKPQVLGILNVNHASFYDGGRYTQIDKALARCDQMLAEGASFIDVGAVSTKPGSAIISHQEEWQRLAPFLSALLNAFPKAYFSVDTYNARVAEKAIEKGAHLINDISGGSLDPLMPKVIGQLKVPYILMHLQGTPETMQKQTQYDNLIKDVAYYFSQKLDEFYAAGANDIILDLGFGFGKNSAQNYSLLKELAFFKQLFQRPILAGLSRKSMIYKNLGIEASDALNGTTVLNTLALQNGASLLRVHDVKPAKEAIKLVTLTQN